MFLVKNFLTLFLIATALLFSACSTQSSQQSAKQVELEQKQELVEFVCNEHNNAEACFVVGGALLEDGFNANNDTERIELLGKAQKYLLKSCDLNHGDGCLFYAMAIMLDSLSEMMINNKQRNFKDIMDKIGKGDLVVYIQYIKKSCELDSSKGCETLGDSYWNGDGVKKDEKLGFLYRKKACDLAQIPKDTLLSETRLLGGTSCVKVGRMYYNGEGVTKNRQLALKYFDMGCGVSGYHCGDYVRYFYNGYNGEFIKVPQDYEFAFKLAKKGCEANDGTSCNYLGILYQEGKGTNQDSKKAFRAFQKLCYEKMNYEDSLCLNNTTKNFENCIGDVKKIGCYNLALSYANGQGVEQNYKRAFGMFKDLCDKDKMASACGIVGECYYNAKGVRQDYREALKYFSVACDMGEQSGCDNHKMMKQNPYGHGLRNSDFR